MERTSSSGWGSRGAESTHCWPKSFPSKEWTRFKRASPPDHAGRGARTPRGLRVPTVHSTRMKALLVRFGKDGGVCGGIVGVLG